MNLDIINQEIEINNTKQYIFDESEMNRLLLKLRYISKLDDSQAMKELDSFCFEIISLDRKLQKYEELDNERSNVKREIENFKKNILEREYELKTANKPFYSDNIFFDTIHEIDQFYYINKNNLDENERKTLIDLLNKTKEMNRTFGLKYFESKLKKLLIERISNITSIDRIRNEINVIYEFFQKINELIPNDFENMIRKCKIKSCYYRAEKNLKDAEIVRAGGNIKKAEKLQAEAEIMFKQDWEIIFPDLEKPELEYKGYKEFFKNL